MRYFPAVRFLPAIVILLLLGMTASNVYPVLKTNLELWSLTPAPMPSWEGVEPGKQKIGQKIYDVDTHLIHRGLLKAPNFADTSHWWYGTWVGQVPFYRPLTSMVFWMEWKLWGDREARYNIVGPLLHIAAVGCLATFALQLYRRFAIPYPLLATLLCGSIFIDGGDILLTQDLITYETYREWKNQPDCLVLIWFSLCLLFYVRDQESHRRTFLPLLMLILLLLTKEAGVFLPLLLPLLELRNGRIDRESWGRMTPLLITLPVYLILRALFLGDAIGYRYGSNDAWTFRLLQNVFGPVSECLAGHRWLLVSAAVYLTIAVCLFIRQTRFDKPMPKRDQWLWLILAPAGLVTVSTFAQYAEQGILDPTQPPIILLHPSSLILIRSQLLFMLSFAALVWKRPQLLAMLYLWALLALGLTLFSPSVLHRYYIVNASFALILGAGLTFLLQGIVRRIQRRWQAFSAEKFKPLSANPA